MTADLFTQRNAAGDPVASSCVWCGGVWDLLTQPSYHAFTTIHRWCGPVADPAAPTGDNE